MDNYFTSFRLLTRFAINKILTAGVLNKNKLRKYTTTGDKQLQKKERGHFEQGSTHQARKGVQLVWLVRTTSGRYT